MINRSERQGDQEKLLRSFVDAGIKPFLDNQNNQVIYGRRGTGKTHLLKVLEPELSGRDRELAIYVDARTLGSTAQFSDSDLPLSERCLSLFQDIFTEIYDALIRYTVERTPPNADAAIDRLDELMAILTSPVERRVAVTAEETARREQLRGLDIGASLGPAAGITGAVRSSGRESQDIRTTFAITAADKVIFPELQTALRRALETLNLHLVILFDEWSSIPMDLQPYLAEFLKRSIIPLQSVTIKIASLEYRSQFSLRRNGDIIGLEIGADLSASLDIDDYYVFDRNPKSISQIYAEILHRHLKSDLGEEYLRDTYGIDSGEVLVSKMFVGYDVFQELVRASEGVIRDLMNIFTNAAVHSHRRGRGTIDRKAILDAARQWYEQDKVRELSEDLRGILEAIIKEVIGNRRARAFLIPRDLEKHPNIQRLFDARVLHLMQRGYADKDNPGTRYNIYSIDYGTYVDLLNTSRAPDIEFSDSDSAADFVVPFDDKRSIRRIILPRSILDRGISGELSNGTSHS
jgi:hypothetical protein